MLLLFLFDALTFHTEVRSLSDSHSSYCIVKSGTKSDRKVTSQLYAKFDFIIDLLLAKVLEGNKMLL